MGAHRGRWRARRGATPPSLGSALYHNININEDRQAALEESQGVSRRLLHVEVHAGVRRGVDGGGQLPSSASASCARTSRPASATWRCASRPGIRAASSRASWTRSRRARDRRGDDMRAHPSARGRRRVRERAVVAGAGDAGLFHARSGHRLVRVRRDHGRAAAQDAAAGIERRRQAVLRRRRQSALVAKNETPLGLSFTVTNRWAFEGKEGFDGKLDNLRGLVGGLDTYYLVTIATKKLDIASLRDVKATQDSAEALHAAGRLARRVREPAAPARVRHDYEDIKSWAGLARRIRATTSSWTPSRTGAPISSSRS